MSRERIDLEGLRFGRLHILREAAPKSGRRRWKCKCDCGKTKLILQDSILAKEQPTRSCGCMAGGPRPGSGPKGFGRRASATRTTVASRALHDTHVLHASHVVDDTRERSAGRKRDPLRAARNVLAQRIAARERGEKP